MKTGNEKKKKKEEKQQQTRPIADSKARLILHILFLENS